MSPSIHFQQRRFSGCRNLAGWILLAGAAAAAPFPIVNSDTPLCDVLAAPAVVEEIGFGVAAGGPFPLAASLDSLYLGVGDPVCPATNDPFLADAVVAILNTSGRPFPDVWYVADASTELSNFDGRVGAGAGPATLLAFKIDAVGDNQPLVYESLHEDGIWEPDEVWYFVIQDYVNTAGAGPAAFGSLGLNSGPGISSSASIITASVASSVVTTVADGGPGSLRQITSDVPAGTTVTFAADLNGQTITLGGTQLLINKDLTIDASALANGITVTGDVTGDGPTSDDSRVFEIGGGANVELKGLTIVAGHTSGNGGGILHSSGNLTLTLTTLSGNSANEGGGIYNSGGTLTFNDGTVSNNTAASYGGGLRNFGDGVIHLNRASISDNTATNGGGGGIFDSFSIGSVTIANSTLAGNSAGFGAGIYSQNSALELTNSTVSGNTTTNNAGGGVYLQESSALLIHVTVAGNTATGSGGGGMVVANSSGIELTLNNSIIAGNSGSPGADIWYFGGTINTIGVNLIGNNGTVTARFPTGAPNANGDLAGVPPRLAPLANYGGLTRTMPPLPGSPAIEGGVLQEGVPATDQRGNSRPSGPLPDIGAVEAFPFSTLALVDSDDDGIDDRIEPAYARFTVGVNDSALDSDGDGSPDSEEFANMTDPDDANDRLRVVSFAQAAGFDPVSNPLFVVTFATFPGLNYELESSATLQDFQVVPGSSFTADDFISTAAIALPPGGGFVRAKRN
jgi:hypothetical protein